MSAGPDNTTRVLGTSEGNPCPNLHEAMSYVERWLRNGILSRLQTTCSVCDGNGISGSSTALRLQHFRFL